MQSDLAYVQPRRPSITYASFKSPEGGDQQAFSYAPKFEGSSEQPRTNDDFLNQRYFELDQQLSAYQKQI